MSLRRMVRHSAAALLICLLSNQLHAYVEFSAQEQQRLREKGAIKACIDPSWMPFEGIDKRGNYVGISADFMQEFSRIMGVPIVLEPTLTWSESMQKARDRQCDILTMLHYNEERARFLNFTAPYLSTPVVLIAREDAPYLDDFGAVNEKTLGIVRGYATESYIRNRFPLVEMVYTDSLEESLRNVSRGKLFAAATTLPTALYLIQQEGLGNLKVAGHTSFTYDLRIGVRKDDEVLASVFQKVVASFPHDLRNQILQRWYTVKVQQQVDYSLLILMAAGFLFIIALLIYRNRTVHAFNAKLAKVNARLSDRNQRLEQVSKRDYLTGVFNRVRLDTEMQQEINRHEQGGSAFSVLLFDLDHFSRINLTHGHGVGDLVLVEACRRLEEQVNDWEHLGRWDGETFVLLCPETRQEEATKLAEKLQRVLHLGEFSEGVSLSASFCVAEHRREESQAQLMRRLENGLHQAKVSGGDQIVTAAEQV